MNSKKIPQGYKKTEIGIIPEDWEVKKLGEVGFCQSGSGFPLMLSLIHI
jgi:type I restriction enzyme S subunit